MDQPPEEHKPEPFVRHGKPDDLTEIDADEVLEAIAQGRDIDVEWGDVRGKLDIGNEKIRDVLPRNPEGWALVRGHIAVQRTQIPWTILDGCKFMGRVSLRSCEFTQDTCFRQAIFANGADFADSIFSHDASFTGATFVWGAILTGAVFRAHADFGFATFAEYASFRRARFSDNVDFASAKMAHPASFTGVDFHENTTWVGLWNHCPPLRALVWCLSLGRVSRDKKPVTDFSGLNTATIMDGSSNPYLKRYIDDEQWIASWRQRHKFLFYVWELSCHCGRSILLWMGWSAAIAVLFGWLYSAHHAWFQQEVGPLSPWYFSIVTFTTLGFGDLTPKPECWLGQLCVMAEVIFGYVMLGGLISIFANKLARRS